MERAGRRKLLLTGFICIAVCNLLTTITDSVLVGSARNPSLLLFLSSSFGFNVVVHVVVTQHLVPELRSLQVLLVFCLISAYELGPGPISWFIAAELFDQPGRPIAMAFTSMLNWGGKFVLALLFPPLLVGFYMWATEFKLGAKDSLFACKK